jgi:hypothetical protein
MHPSTAENSVRAAAGSPPNLPRASRLVLAATGSRASVVEIITNTVHIPSDLVKAPPAAGYLDEFLSTAAAISQKSGHRCPEKYICHRVSVPQLAHFLDLALFCAKMWISVFTSLRVGQASVASARSPGSARNLPQPRMSELQLFETQMAQKVRTSPAEASRL